MIQALGAILLILASGAALAALFAVISLLLPGVAGRSQAALENTARRAFVLGLVNLVFFLAVAVLLVKLAQAGIPVIGFLFALLAVLILVGLVLLAAVGLTGLVKLLSLRMGGAHSPLAGVLRASLLLELAALTPFVGWWVFAPLLLVTGLGAGILAIFQRLPAAPAAAAPEV